MPIVITNDNLKELLVQQMLVRVAAVSMLSLSVLVGYGTICVGTSMFSSGDSLGKDGGH